MKHARTMTMRRALLMSGVGLMLIACSPEGSPVATASKQLSISNGASGAAAVASWNAQDACATLDKSVVEQVIGIDVKSATLSRVSPKTSSTAGFSTCTYDLGEGRNIQFFARTSPIPDNTPDAIASAKSAVSIMTPKAAEDVVGVGKGAFWITDLGQLQFFIGEDQYGFINLSGGDKMKARDYSIALAKKIGG